MYIVKDQYEEVYGTYATLTDCLDDISVYASRDDLTIFVCDGITYVKRTITDEWSYTYTITYEPN